MDSKNLTIAEIKNCCSNLEKQILTMYLDKRSQKYICNHLNVKRSKIDALVSKYNLTRFRDRKNNKCRNIDINNPTFWYFLGLFASDGNLYTTNGIEVIQFTLKDEELIDLIIYILDFTGEKRKYCKSGKTYYYIRISDTVLIKTVKEIFNSDCHNKTANLCFPKINNNLNIKMFLRGYSDGDGSFCKTATPGFYNYSIYFHTKNMAETVLNLFKSITAGHPVSYKHSKASGTMLEIYRREDVYKFAKYLYSDYENICLTRKKERAIQHINKYELKI